MMDIGDKVKVKDLHEVYHGFNLSDWFSSLSGTIGEIEEEYIFGEDKVYKLSGLNCYFPERALELADPPEKVDPSLISFV